MPPDAVVPHSHAEELNLDFCSIRKAAPSPLFSVLSEVYLGHLAPLVLAPEHQNDNVQCQSCTYSRRLYSKEKYKWKIQSTVADSSTCTNI